MVIQVIGIQHTAIYTPEGIETAKILEEKAGIPENIIIEKFGLYEKRVAPSNVQTSDLAIRAGEKILEHIDRELIDVVIYFGSPHKDYHVWPIVPKIQYELGLKNAYVFEMMNVSSCFPIALKVARDMIYSDKKIRNILLVGGCKESNIIDYQNVRSRFMFNFADGGAAALVSRHATKSEILSSSILTDGSFHDDVRIPAGGTVMPASEQTVQERLHYIDVKDPMSMKERLDPVSMTNFVKVVEQALENSGYTTKDLSLLMPLHTKKSMYDELLALLELDEHQGIYLDHYGHMSSLDPCYGLHLAEQEGKLKQGDIAVVVSAGTGYTWAATVVKWNK